MNKSSHRVGTNQSQQPQHKQYNEYCPQHNWYSFRVEVLIQIVPRLQGALIEVSHFQESGSSSDSGSSVAAIHDRQ